MTEVMSRLPEVRSAVTALGELLEHVRSTVEAGEEIDLGGLAETTAAVCAAVEALPHDEARPLVAELSTLVESCETIARTYTARLAVEAAFPAP